MSRQYAIDVGSRVVAAILGAKGYKGLVRLTPILVLRIYLGVGEAPTPLATLVFARLKLDEGDEHGAQL